MDRMSGRFEASRTNNSSFALGESQASQKSGSLYTGPLLFNTSIRFLFLALSCQSIKQQKLKKLYICCSQVSTIKKGVLFNSFEIKTLHQGQTESNILHIRLPKDMENLTV